jgi:cation:H+ antiporter
MPPPLGTLLLALLALFLLGFGAELLVRGASALALRLGVSPLAVGLTVVAFGTSAPELVVSLGAALKGASDIAVGNVVGSNICNIALILGVTALVRPAQVHAKIFRLDVPLLIVSSLGLAGLLLTVGIGRPVGALMVAGLAGFTIVTLRQARATAGVPVELPAGGQRRAGLDVLFIAVGLIGLTQGGRLLVAAAVTLAESMGVSQATIGLTIVAVGTSLPELATSVVATAKGQGDLAVGNIVGSNIFNILGILGVTAVVRPLALGGITGVDLGVMVVLALAVLPIMRSGFVVSRREGAGLLAAYGGYLWWLIGA